MKQTIEVHTFKINKKRNRNPISFSAGQDLYVLVKNSFVSFIDSSMTGPVDSPDTENRIVKIPAEAQGQVFHGFNDQRRCVYGIIESGLYGRRLEIVNKDNPRELLYSSDVNAALIKPFFFLLTIPRIGDTGFIIVERTDEEGIFPLFLCLLRGFLNTYYLSDNQQCEYSIKQKNYLSHEYVSSLTNGDIKSYRLTMSSLPRDLADRYMCNGLEENCSISIELKFKGGIRPTHTIANAIKNNNPIFSSEDINTIFNDSKKSIVTSSSINGVSKERTVFLGDEAKNAIRPFYIVDVEANNRGYSDYNSIKQAVFNFVDLNSDLVALIRDAQI